MTNPHTEFTPESPSPYTAWVGERDGKAWFQSWKDRNAASGMELSPADMRAFAAELNAKADEAEPETEPPIGSFVIAPDEPGVGIVRTGDGTWSPALVDRQQRFTWAEALRALTGAGRLVVVAATAPAAEGTGDA